MKLWEDDKRMVAVTGVPGRHALSTNPKTGPMAQAWVLPRHEPPVTPEGDAIACGDCPLQSAPRRCYVRPITPKTVWSRYRDGPVEAVPEFHLGLRITAWGDPGLVPLTVWWDLLRKAPFHTGYTHQWRKLDARQWGFLMASVESQGDMELAWELGWRTFRITTKQEGKHKEETWCLNQERKQVQCIQCRLCDGTHRHIAIRDHGPTTRGKRR